MGLARGLSLMARLNTLLKVRRGGLISGHDYQFQSQAMGGAPCRECRGSGATACRPGRLGCERSGLGCFTHAPEELPVRRPEHSGSVWHSLWAACAKTLRMVCL